MNAGWGTHDCGEGQGTVFDLVQAVYFDVEPDDVDRRAGSWRVAQAERWVVGGFGDRRHCELRLVGQGRGRGGGEGD